MNEQTIAAIDVGTNSVHLVVARPTPHGPLDILAREKVSVRLGSGGSDMKQLDPAAVERAVEAIGYFAGIAAAYGAHTVAVATSAVRESENPGLFLDAVREATGVVVDVIPGAEEARLIHLGAISAVPAGPTNHLIIDIGGGSTELILGSGTEPILTRSLKLGHVRLTDRFLPGGVIEDGAVKKLRKYLKSFLAPTAAEFVAIGHDTAIGCSGTIENVAAIAARLGGHKIRTIDNLVLTRDGLEAVVDDLVSRHRPADREPVPGLDPARADVIVAGAVLLRQLFKSLEISEMIVSPNALREGVVLDHVSRRAGDTRALHHLSDLRHRSVMGVAERYEEDLTHAEHATDLALQLFDRTAVIHDLGEAERQVLEAAGLLHNVGRFIAHAAHHKHSYYLIRHSEQLLGFTEHELEMVALVARYHRKSAPRSSHAEFARLSAPDRRTVKVLAGLLRVGIGLDRSYRRAVTAARADIDDEQVRITLDVEPGADAELELYAARERSPLLADALGRAVSIDVAEEP
ncbi:MAG: Ppx/GppA phosphatase family protein [Acidimicrobiales bacterium]|nr:Ppx/GppA phosphatase family protein [Acidimicrobiales bacterium]